MSLIREALRLEEPREYLVRAMRIEPPQNVSEAFRVHLLLYSGSIITLEAISIEFRGAAVGGTISKRDLCVKMSGEGCLSRIDLAFPEGALATYDNGHLAVE